MFDERRIFAALAVMLFAYVVLAIAAYLVRRAPRRLPWRRWRAWLAARHDRNS